MNGQIKIKKINGDNNLRMEGIGENAWLSQKQKTVILNTFFLPLFNWGSLLQTLEILVCH
jgi:hypothetical protein